MEDRQVRERLEARRTSVAGVLAAAGVALAGALVAIGSIVAIVVIGAAVKCAQNPDCIRFG